MPHTLSFHARHRSIVSLDASPLPEFVVLTGRNGSGKTHLLEALKGGQVTTSLTTSPSAEIQLFDWNSIIPRDTGVFEPQQENIRRSQWYKQVRNFQEHFLPTIQQAAQQIGIPSEYCSSWQKLNALTPQKISSCFPDLAQASNICNQLQQEIKGQAQNIANHALGSIGDADFQSRISQILQVNPEQFLAQSESSFFNHHLFLWGVVDPFQQAFGRTFTTYRELVHQNDRLKNHPPENELELRYLSPEKFEVQFKEPPWNFVNRILEKCNLDFRVDKPLMHEIGSYEPKLHKLSSDVEMRFQDLSSGEKVLMSFALCLYNAQDPRQQTLFPKLLLLDEIDAPLHPSMTLSLLKTIQDVLVRDKGISVILTTHSPSTVALSPEDSIYKMNPDGPRIEKVSRSSALSLLTVGVPTLSISFDGRRQVFVESRTDAKLYEKLYQSYKEELNSERSLVFIEVGNTDQSGGEQNAGCAQVTRLVEGLVKGGNSSVLGLVDWDGERPQKDRIRVLSHGLRDGLESLLLDPVLLAATVINENHEFCRQKGIIEKHESYVGLGEWNSDRWQSTVNDLQNLILGSSAEGHRAGVEIKYLNDIKLHVALEYVHMDDHALERRILEIFPFLKPKNNRAGGLMEHVIDKVLLDFPKFLPVDFLDTLRNLLEADI
jgi:predicted ATPase